MTATERRELIQLFHRSEVDGKQAVFQRRFDLALSKNEADLQVVVRDGDPVALLCVERESSLSTVSVLRFSDRNHTATLAREILSRLIQEGAARGARIIQFVEDDETETLASALEDCGFRRIGGRWTKYVLDGVLRGAQVADLLAAVDYDEGSVHVRSLGASAENGTLDTRLAVERLLWPCKVAGLDVPTFVVPIRDGWAMKLFDSKLWQSDLFVADDELLLFRFENVYYSALAKGALEAPARILWYVSRGVDPSVTGRVRAVSYLDRVESGSARDLFARNRRLGVYGWDDLMRLARRDPDRRLIAIHFSGTELLKNAVPLSRLKRVVCGCGHPWNNLQSPLKVCPACFERIYVEGDSNAR